MEQRQPLSIISSDSYSLGINLTPRQIYCIKVAVSMWLQYHELSYYPVIDNDGKREYRSDDSTYHLCFMGYYNDDAELINNSIVYSYKSLEGKLKDSLTQFITELYPYDRLYLVSSTYCPELLPLLCKTKNYELDQFGIFTITDDSMRSIYIDYSELQSLRLTKQLDEWSKSMYVITDPNTAELWSLELVSADYGIYRPSINWQCILPLHIPLKIAITGIPVRLGTLCKLATLGSVSAVLEANYIHYYYYNNTLFCSLQSFNQLVTALLALQGVTIDICNTSLFLDYKMSSLEEQVRTIITSNTNNDY